MNNLSQYSDSPKTLNKVYESVPQWDSGGIFGRNMTFVVENYGLVKMMFLKITIEVDVATSAPTPISPYIFENIFMESNGIAFTRQTTTYSISRINDLSGSGVGDQILNAASFDTTKGSGTITLPLFMFPIDGQVFNPGLYKNLTVRAVTKQTKEQMGFSINPTSISVKLVAIYEQGANFLLTCPPLTNFYNMTQDIYTITTGATQPTGSYVVNLNNPSKVKSLIFMMRKVSEAGALKRITSVKLDTTTQTLGTFDNLTNFYLGTNNGANDGSSFKIKLDSYIKLNKNMNPAKATITFQDVIPDPPATSDYYLYVVYEYESVIEDQDGFLMENFEQSII